MYYPVQMVNSRITYDTAATHQCNTKHLQTDSDHRIDGLLGRGEGPLGHFGLDMSMGSAGRALAASIALLVLRPWVVGGTVGDSRAQLHQMFME